MIVNLGTLARPGASPLLLYTPLHYSDGHITNYTILDPPQRQIPCSPVSLGGKGRYCRGWSQFTIHHHAVSTRRGSDWRPDVSCGFHYERAPGAARLQANQPTTARWMIGTDTRQLRDQDFIRWVFCREMTIGRLPRYALRRIQQTQQQQLVYAIFQIFLV